ncbi:MAG: CDP-alcohol phosphatidyltransferase family protein [Acidimicrobiales bacterium]
MTTAFGPSALATPANVLTMVRVAAVPVLVLLILGGGQGWGVLALWTVLSTSDLADGWLARRQGATRSGAFLDPLADKVLVLGAMAAMVSVGLLWWVPVAIIAVREALVSVYRSAAGRRGISVPARMGGKIKTWLQSIAVGLALAPVAGSAYGTFADAVLAVAVVLTVITGAQFIGGARAR